MNTAFARLPRSRSKYCKNPEVQISTFRIRSMNLRFSSLASVLATSSAWIPTSNTLFSTHTCQYPSLTFPPSRTFSDFSLRSTAAPEEVSTPALSPQGKQVADGHVVSAFKGGFIAIRVDDDIADILAKSPEIVDTTKLLPKDSKKSSLGGDLVGRQVVFQNGHTGVVVTHRPPIAFVYTDMEHVEFVEGGVKVLDSFASVDVDESRKALDCFGRSTLNEGDDTTASSQNMQRPIFAPIPKVSDISLINSPLLTGVTMFDALAPIGKGQNMLLVGHDIQDMRQYVCDILSIQAKQTKCIYASTTDNNAVVDILAKNGLTDDVVLVSNSKTDGKDKVSMAAEATVTAATACAIAEAFAIQRGLDTFVVVDTIDQHKSLWDATTRVLVDVFGVDAVVKGDRDGGASSEMRAFFSSLVQRSAQYKKTKGGGSVTLLLLTTIPKMADDTDEDIVFSVDDFAGSPKKVLERIDLLVKRNVPLTAANLRKIQIPVPSESEGGRRLALQHVDDLISMSDGQIWLDEGHEKKGRRPSMDFQRSLTRIGIGADTESRADAPAIRRVVEGLRLDLSQAGDMDGADAAINATKKQYRNALAWLLAMHQPSASGARRLSESCVALLAASKGYLGDSIDNGAVAGTSAGDALMSSLLSHAQSNAVEAMESIDSTQDLTDDTREAIEKAIQSFFSS